VTMHQLSADRLLNNCLATYSSPKDCYRAPRNSPVPIGSYLSVTACLWCLLLCTHEPHAAKTDSVSTYWFIPNNPPAENLRATTAALSMVTICDSAPLQLQQRLWCTRRFLSNAVRRDSAEPYEQHSPHAVCAVIPCVAGAGKNRHIVSIPVLPAVSQHSAWWQHTGGASTHLCEHHQYDAQGLHHPSLHPPPRCRHRPLQLLQCGDQGSRPVADSSSPLLAPHHSLLAATQALGEDSHSLQHSTVTACTARIGHCLHSTARSQPAQHRSVTACTAQIGHCLHSTDRSLPAQHSTVTACTAQIGHSLHSTDRSLPASTHGRGQCIRPSHAAPQRCPSPHHGIAGRGQHSTAPTLNTTQLGATWHGAAQHSTCQHMPAKQLAI
jgi:hypothetical protein